MSFSFNNMIWSPVDYAEASVLAREVGDEMLSRLEWMTLKPRVIVDAGCGTGEMSERLQKRYPDAHVIALDLSEDMVQHATHNSCVCADAGYLPLPSQSVDLLFANFLLPWQANIEPMLREWRRVLRPDGLLIFSAFGPDTLREWQTFVERDDMPAFIDMHDVGDLLLKLKFADPVLDVNYYTMSYREQTRLFQDLQSTGMLMTMPDAKGHALSTAEDGCVDVTYEVVFAHAFIPAENEEMTASADGIVRVPLSHLRRRLKMQ